MTSSQPRSCFRAFSTQTATERTPYIPFRYTCLSGFVLLLLLLSADALADDSAPPPLGTTITRTGITFRVWAPHASSVSVIGDFNNWSPRKSDVMELDHGAGIWSVHIRTARRGHAYKYLINGNLKKRDPYARTVSPDGVNSVIYDPSKYAWGGDRQVEYPLEDLVIYELHIGTFNDPKPKDGKPATFYDAIKKLDALVEMGVNCVEILPVHEFSGQHSWGYNPSDVFAVEQAYGGPDGLKTFVKECHRRGLQVHLDVVHNHYGRENLEMLNFDGSATAGKGDIYFYEEDDVGLSMTPWGPRPDFSVPQVRRFIKDNTRMWLDEYHVDGFRWDSTINIRGYDEGQKQLDEGSSLLDELNRLIKKDYPGRWSIAEDSVDRGNFHASWQYSFHHRVMPGLSARSDADRNIADLAEAVCYHPSMRRVVYTDNHDEAGKINGQVRIASDIDPETPGSEYARKLSGLGSVMTLTAAGVPLLFMGNEMQEDGYFHDDIPLEWGKANVNSGLVALHRDLIHLRRDLDGAGAGLKGRESKVALVNENAKFFVYWRWHEGNPADKMVVAINLSGQPLKQTAVPFPSAGNWIQRLYSEWSIYDGKVRRPPLVKIKVEEDLSLPFDLAPYSAMIFSLETRPAGAAKPVKATAGSTRKSPSKHGPRKHTFREMAISGNFSKSDVRMKPVSGYLWEAKVEFKNATNIEFRIASGKKKWGVLYQKPIDPPISQFLRPGGPSMKIKSELTGWYLIGFDEQSRRITVEETTPEKPKQIIAFRTWTDARGKGLKAKLVGVRGNKVVLEKKDGKRITVTVKNLSDADQMYVSTVSRE